MIASDIFQKQIGFFDSNQTKDPSFRIAQLKKLKRVLKDHENFMYRAIYEDFKKSEFETYLTELSQLYHEIDVFVRHIKRWSRPKRVATNLANFPARSCIIPEPLGVTLVIGAWNYPYALSLMPAVSALAAGNTVILKPSELPSNTSRVMADLVNAHFPSDFFCVIEGGVEQTTELLQLSFDKIFFTGSVAVGRVVYQAAAKHLTPVTLELGGKSPTFVLRDCDIERTAQRIVWAKYLNAGQTCVAPDYLLVERSIEVQLCQAIEQQINKYYSYNEGIRENYLQIINTKSFDRLSALVDEDKVFCGGVFDCENRYIAPTVLRDVTFDDRVMEEEIFGPLLPIIAFDHLDEVIAQVKQKPKPLSCYVYSNNAMNVNKILYEVSFGGGAVNDSITHLANSALPFGGVGHSGIGSYHGKAGFDAFTHYKSVLKKRTWFEPSLKYYPYTSKKMSLLKLFVG